MIDISQLLQKYYTERKYSKQNTEIIINNPESISNLCHIDYAVFGQSGALTKKDQEEIIGIIYDGKFFQVNDNTGAGTQYDTNAGQQGNGQNNSAQEKLNNKNSPTNQNNITSQFEMSNLKTLQQDTLLNTQYNMQRQNSIEKLNQTTINHNNNDITYINDQSFIPINKQIALNDISINYNNDHNINTVGNISQFDTISNTNNLNHMNKANNMIQNNSVSFKNQLKYYNENITLLQGKDGNKNEEDQQKQDNKTNFFTLNQITLNTQINSKSDIDLLQKNNNNDTDQVIKEEEDHHYNAIETPRDNADLQKIHAKNTDNHHHQQIYQNSNKINIPPLSLQNIQNNQLIETVFGNHNNYQLENIITPHPQIGLIDNLNEIDSIQEPKQPNIYLFQDNKDKNEDGYQKQPSLMLEDLPKQQQSRTNSFTRELRTNSVNIYYFHSKSYNY